MVFPLLRRSTFRTDGLLYYSGLGSREWTMKVGWGLGLRILDVEGENLENQNPKTENQKTKPKNRKAVKVGEKIIQN